MNHAAAVKLITKLYFAGDRTTFFLIGPPGIGKTQIGRDVATIINNEAIFEPLDTSSMMPEDLLGIPSTKGGVTSYCPQEWCAPLCEDGARGVLMLDDITQSARSVQVASRQIALTKRVHHHIFAEGILVIATGNRREDKSGASTMPAHWLNSVMTLEISPDFGGWEKWYLDKGYPGAICAFLRARPSHFSNLPSDQDKKGSFATPRQWEALAQKLHILDEDELGVAASGLVGSGVASEFVAFMKISQQLVDPRRVLVDPKGSLPDPKNDLEGPDRMWAMVVGLAEATVHDMRDRSAAKMAKYVERFIVATRWVAQGSNEYFGVAYTTYRSLGGSKNAFASVLGDLGGRDESFMALIEELADVLGE